VEDKISYVRSRITKVPFLPRWKTPESSLAHIAIVEEDGAIWERFDLAETGDLWFPIEPIQIAFALGQRQASQINAVLVQQIEYEEHQQRLIWPARAHRVHQPVEVRAALEYRETATRANRGTSGWAATSEVSAVGRGGIDLIGQRFDHLRAVDLAGKSGARFMWLCVCDCGTKKTSLPAIWEPAIRSRVDACDYII
jgi:hypothetical protein